MTFLTLTVAKLVAKNKNKLHSMAGKIPHSKIEIETVYINDMTLHTSLRRREEYRDS